MRNILIFLVSVFIVCLLYLHQKVTVCVQAYTLTENHKYYNDLVDKRDVLLYNLSKRISLDKINQWAQANEFGLSGGEMVLAFRKKGSSSPVSEFSKVQGRTRLNSRIFNLPGEPEALAKNKR